MTAFELTFVVLYLALMAFLSVVALHRFILALAARRLKPAELTEPAEWPTVLVQVPLYNERYVAERVIDAVSVLDYPADKLTIQILDDSTDGTSSIVAAAVDKWKQKGVAIEHVRRGNRDQFKAGALAAGLLRSNAELVAVFDADFLPPADMLRRLTPSFADPKVGMVQARWGHINRQESLLTETEAVLLDGHFVNEHGGRFVRGCFFNFNGTAGIWRRAAIDDAGGWSGATLTEDLDLSYRAQLKGWKFVYRPDVEVPGELPPDTQAFKSQQHRWAKGSIETALLLLPRIWKTPGISFRTRFEATFHLAGNFAYPLVLLLTLLMPWAIMIRLQAPLWATLLVDSIFLVGSTGSLVSFYMLAETSVGNGWRALKHLPLVLALGIGMAVNNTRAVIEALVGKRTAFNRTPKLGDQRKNIESGYIVNADWQAIVELVLGAYLLGAVLAAVEAQRFVAIPFLVLFATGFLFLSLGSLWRGGIFRGKDKALTAQAMPKRI